MCQEAARAGYGVSMFERLSWGLVQPHLLDTQYRMHPQLAQYPSQAFYGGRMRSGVTAAQRPSALEWPCAAVPGYFHDVEGQEGRVGHSRTNEKEATVVAQLVKWALQQGVEAADIAVIATFAAQVRTILAQLQSMGLGWGGVTVNTVDAYQGQERPYIIISYVRSGPGSLGFVDDERRINVAITRAQKARVCVGHRATLRRSAALRGLIEEY